MESALREGSADPGLRLIETMLWDGAGYPRRDLHLARLARGAAMLGWTLPGQAIEAALARAAMSGPPTSGPAASGPPASGPPASGPARLRLTLARDGTVDLQAGPLPAILPVWRLGLAPARLASGDPWLRLKTTRRPLYDAARAALPAGFDEMLFQNERGEVCDGTITTLFFDRGEGLRTPPLACGLLPGVLRAEMACPEDILPARDLGRVTLWVGNALRGLMPAVWAADDVPR